MFDKKITFCATDKNMLEIWPHPQPASRFIPEEYKKLERFKSNNLHTPTVKTCMPFLDSLTAGYIIPFDQDYLVDPVETDFTIVPANREQSDFGFHNQAQLPKEWKKTTGENAGKFHNKWLIKTPPGYSCLFLPVINQQNENFTPIAGIVDTDNFYSPVNFPIILHKKGTFEIKKGDPIVTVIPFKRDNWKMELKKQEEEKVKKFTWYQVSNYMNIYKRFYRTKKSWK